MNFAVAFTLLLAGKRIRRESWDAGYHWAKDVLGIWQFNPDEPTMPNKVTQATDDELLASDWELA